MTTRNRESDAKRFIEAAGDVQGNKVIWCDGCSYSFKHDWEQIDSDHIGIGEAMNQVFKQYPDEDFYGWLADDLIPHTPGWDIAIGQATQGINVVSCNDLWLRGKRDDDGTPWVSGAVCLGGDLVRAMNWWAPPGMFQLYIDTVWVSLALQFGLLKYLDDIVVEHLHPANGKRVRDETDSANTRRSADRDLFVKYSTDEDLIKRVSDEVNGRS